MNIASVLESIRNFLGWSFQDLSMKSGKYSPEYLKQVHEGRPFPCVEKELIMTYIRGLAERAVHLSSGGQVRGELHEKLVAKFVQVVRRNDLLLEDTKALVERVARERALEPYFRTQTMDVNVGIDIAWEEILDDIVRDLNMPDQGSLFDGIGGYTESTDLPISDIPASPKHLYQAPQHLAEIEAEAQCPRCDYIQSESQGSRCVRCGYGSIANPNW